MGRQGSYWTGRDHVPEIRWLYRAAVYQRLGRPVRFQAVVSVHADFSAVISAPSRSPPVVITCYQPDTRTQCTKSHA